MCIIIYICIIIYRWLQIRLQCIGAFIVLFVSLLAVIGRDTLSAGVVGLIITNALHVSWIKYNKTKYQKDGQNVPRCYIKTSLIIIEIQTPL